MTYLEIGSARSQPGTYSYGVLDALTLPSGGIEQFPVIIGQGRRDGPVFWLTAGIHGDEYTGIQVIHRLLTPDLLGRLRGAIVAVPTLNPAGLRIGERTPYYMRKQDPNRLFPTRRLDARGEVVSPLETAYRRLFEYIQTTAHYLVDLHNYSLHSIPFAFRDPVYYYEEGERVAAQTLYDKTSEMLNAFGHTIVNEFVSAEYLRRNLHRSVSGASLHVAGIPAFTVELGGYLTIDTAIVASALCGIRNVMRWAGMLDDPAESIQGVTIIRPGYPIRRTHHPHAPRSGIVQFLVKAGDVIRAGDPVARLTDIYGRPLGENDGLIRSENAGFVLGLSQGAAFYQHDPLVNLAVRDDSQMIVPYPA